MNNIIVRETSSEIRAIARNALKDNWFKVFIGVLVYYIMTVTIPNIFSGLIPSAGMTYYNQYFHSNLTLSYVASLYNLFLTGAFSLGLCSFMLAFFRKKDINPGYIFNGFEYFIKSLGLFLIMSVFIFLWTLLLIVPGIIAAIRYSQAFFILADHPEKGVLECLNESKYYMNGNKARFFCMGLSFIGWCFLAALCETIIMDLVFMPISLVTGGGIASSIFDLISTLPVIFLLAYISTAQTAFYDLVSGNLAAMPRYHEDDYHF